MISTRKERLREGLCCDDIKAFCKRFMPQNFAGEVYSMDNINYEMIKKRLKEGKASSCVVNTSNENEQGEHWVAVHISDQGHTEYFDSYGLPPIQRGVQQLCTLFFYFVVHFFLF